MPLVFSGKQPLLAPLVFYGAFGPALAGIAVTRIIDPKPGHGSRNAPWIAFVAAWIPVTMVFILHIVLRTKTNLSPPVIVMSAVIGLLPAFVLSSAFSRVQGVRNYLTSLVKPSGNINWYLIAILVIVHP